MNNKIINAAGLIKDAKDLAKVIDAPLDYYMLGSYTLEPINGNPTAYNFSDKGWNWNGIGLHNPGIGSEAVEEVVEILKVKNTPFWISIVAEYNPWNTKRAISKALTYNPSGIEINISCPNYTGPSETFSMAFDLWTQFMYYNIDLYFKVALNMLFDFKDVKFYTFINNVITKNPLIDPFGTKEKQSIFPSNFGITSSNSITLPLSQGGFSGSPLFIINKAFLEKLSTKFYGNLNLMAVGGVSSNEEIEQYYNIAGVKLVQVGSEYMYEGKKLFSKVYS